MIVTGRAIDGKKACSLGLVDQLFDSTQAVIKSDVRNDGSTVYKYQWLSGLLACMENRVIGNKPFAITQRVGMTAVSSTVDVTQLSERISQEMMISTVSENWEECERKAELKYLRRRGCCRSVCAFILDTLVYTLTFLQLLRKVGVKMVAPYACLLTTLRCTYARTWREAMIINTRGMASLIMSAESAGLMSLFLVTRKLKKLATNFGLNSASGMSFKQIHCSVVVYVSNDMLPLATAFVQSLLFNEIPVLLVVDKTFDEVEGRLVIQKHFDYALKRKYISIAEVGRRMELLSVRDEAGAIRFLEEDDSTSVLVIDASSQSFPSEKMLRQSAKVRPQTH
jgi:uncharacterized integral membrane protein